MILGLRLIDKEKLMAIKKDYADRSWLKDWQKNDSFANTFIKHRGFEKTAAVFLSVFIAMTVLAIVILINIKGF